MTALDWNVTELRSRVEKRGREGVSAGRDHQGVAAGHGEISRGIGRAFFLFVLRDREKE